MTDVLVHFDADDLAVPAEIDEEAAQHIDWQRPAWGDTDDDAYDREVA